MSNLNLDDAEAAELLEKLLEQDQIIEMLGYKIARLKTESNDLKESLADATKVRDKLSREIRHPAPLLAGSRGGDGEFGGEEP